MYRCAAVDELAHALPVVEPSRGQYGQSGKRGGGSYTDDEGAGARNCAEEQEAHGYCESGRADPG